MILMLCPATPTETLTQEHRYFFPSKSTSVLPCCWKRSLSPDTVSKEHSRDNYLRLTGYFCRLVGIQLFESD